jgi:hypothetical protein
LPTNGSRLSPGRRRVICFPTKLLAIFSHARRPGVYQPWIPNFAGVLFGTNVGLLRAKRWLTGDWIIFAKHEDQKYYLDLATLRKADIKSVYIAGCGEEVQRSFRFLFEIHKHDGYGNVSDRV